jgi:oxygen-independent coproporphyrinogen-3 oxidase
MDAPKEEQTARQFEILVALTKEAGYDHYEISNFCLPPHYAVHNLSYWQGKHYLGIGAAAHSYNGTARQWNVSNNALYIKSLEQGLIPFEQEKLTEIERFNEYLMIGLRTRWGVSRAKIADFGEKYAEHFLKKIHLYQNQGYVRLEGDNYIFTDTGKLVSDSILSNLFF